MTNLFTTGTLIKGRYKLIKELGKGGFSVVWLASDTMSATEVALKVYAPERGLDQDGLEQFGKEYRHTRGLQHPNLLTPDHLDVIEETGSPFLCMRYCPNGSLHKWLLQSKEVSEAKLAEILDQVGTGLSYLHSKGVLHQDIKPDNILIDETGRFLLTDFGISSQMQSTLKKATANQSYMTTAYAPPERFTADPVDTEAGDIFSLGVSLYELCSGQVPWDGAGGMILNLGAEIPNLPEKYTRRLNNLMQSCLNREYNQRPSAQKLAEAARVYLRQGHWPELTTGGRQTRRMEPDAPASQSRPTQKKEEEPPQNAPQREKGSPLADPGPAAAAAPKQDRSGVIKAAVVVVLLLVLVAGGWYYMSGAEDQIDPEVVQSYNTLKTQADLFYELEQWGQALERYEQAYGVLARAESADSMASVRTILEDAAWQGAQQGGSPWDYETYLGAYPSGRYASQARNVLPEVTTDAVSGITTSRAQSGGRVDREGSSEVTARGVCYATRQNPTTTDSCVSSGSGTGSFMASLTGLSPGTTYYVRGYATSTVGTSFGEQRSFTTSVQTRDTQTAVVDVRNPRTGRTWMDRNLGASRAATSSTDTQAYGDLYQWGRAADGHQKWNSATTSTLSSTDQPGHGSFILVPGGPFDWRSPQNNNLWQGVNGINNPCPSGYRLPTGAEWNAERQSWSSNNPAGAFASPLKLPLPGTREGSSGLFLTRDYPRGQYWSSSVSDSNVLGNLFIVINTALIYNEIIRSHGNSVRCIKD